MALPSLLWSFPIFRIQPKRVYKSLHCIDWVLSEQLLSPNAKPWMMFTAVPEAREPMTCPTAWYWWETLIWNQGRRGVKTGKSMRTLGLLWNHSFKRICSSGICPVRLLLSLMGRSNCMVPFVSYCSLNLWFESSKSWCGNSFNFKPKKHKHVEN